MKYKRFIALALCLMLLASLVPAAAADGETAPEETVSAGMQDTPEEPEEPQDSEEPEDSEEPAEPGEPAESEEPEDSAEPEGPAESEEPEDGDIMPLSGNVAASGVCGDDLSWFMTDDYVLRISGTGGMWDFWDDQPGWYAFRRYIPTVIIGDGVTSVGDNAFSGFSCLTGVSLPATLTAVGESAFAGCSSLVSVTLPSSLQSLSYYAFDSCSSLGRITIPASLTWIGEGVFSRCTSLTAIFVQNGCSCCVSPDGVLLTADRTAILAYPCGLKGSYEVPDGIKTISPYAFCGCTGLTAITFPDTLRYIYEYSFTGCTGLTGAEFPETLELIATSAFAQSGLSGEITIPASVIELDTGAFEDCDAITAFTVAEGNENYSSADGVLFSDGGSTLMQYPAGKAAADYVIPDGVSQIMDCAFENSKVTSVSIPHSCGFISGRAFAGCSSLSTVKFRGDAPFYITASAFTGVCADAYYPMDNSTWTSDVKKNYGGSLTWSEYFDDSLLLDAPVLTAVLNYADYMKIVWEPVDGASLYRVSYRIGTGDWVVLCDTASTRVNMYGCEDGATYTFRVECRSSGGKLKLSSESNRIGQIRLLSPDMTVSRFGVAGTVEGSGFTVRWNATTGGSCYKIYYREQGGSWALYANYAKSNNTRYVNIRADVTNASTTAGAKFPDLVIGNVYEFAVLTATSQAGITSGFPAACTGYIF